MTIDNSTITYLVEFAKGLDAIDPKQKPELIERCETVKAKHKLDADTVELAEKVLVFIQQAFVEQKRHNTKGCNYELLDTLSCEKLEKIKERIAPIIEEALIFSPTKKTPSLTKRIEKVKQLLNEPLTAPVDTQPDILGYLKGALTYIQETAQQAGVAAVKGYVEIQSEAEEEFINNETKRLKKEIQVKTNSFAAGELASVSSQKVCEFLMQVIVNCKELDPIARPAFLKDEIFTDESCYTTDPQHTMLGQLLATLLTSEEPKDLFKKVIELNILKATSNIVEAIERLKDEQSFMLVDLCTACLQEVADENTPHVGIANFEKFSTDGTELIFRLAFPKGEQDLYFPSVLGLTDQYNLPNFRGKIFSLVKDVVKEQISTFMEDLKGKHDIKNLLLYEGYSSLLPIIEGGPKKAQTRLAGILAVPGIATGTLSLAPLGIVYIVMKIILDSIIGIFTSPKALPETPDNQKYPRQEEFNKSLKEIAQKVIDESDSSFLRYVAKHKLDSSIEEYGPKIAEAIREIDFFKIFNTSCESFMTSVVGPGGKWEKQNGEQHYRAPPLKVPKTLLEEKEKEQKILNDEATKAQEVDELQQQFGKKIDGLLQLIAKPHQLEHTDLKADEIHTAAQKIANSLHKRWVAFANACIIRLVKLFAFALGAKKKLQKVSGAFHTRVKHVRQDIFIHQVGLSLQNILEPKP